MRFPIVLMCFFGIFGCVPRNYHADTKIHEAELENTLQASRDIPLFSWGDDASVIQAPLGGEQKIKLNPSEFFAAITPFLTGVRRQLGNREETLRIGNAGPGLYFAEDPFVSQGYGTVLTIAFVGAGTRVWEIGNYVNLDNVSLVQRTDIPGILFKWQGFATGKALVVRGDSVFSRRHRVLRFRFRNQESFMNFVESQDEDMGDISDLIEKNQVFFNSITGLFSLLKKDDLRDLSQGKLTTTAEKVLNFGFILQGSLERLRAKALERRQHLSPCAGSTEEECIRMLEGSFKAAFLGVAMLPRDYEILKNSGTELGIVSSASQIQSEQDLYAACRDYAKSVTMPALQGLARLTWKLRIMLADGFGAWK